MKWQVEKLRWRFMSSCLHGNKSHRKYKNKYSILSQLFPFWGCNFVSFSTRRLRSLFFSISLLMWWCAYCSTYFFLRMDFLCWKHMIRHKKQAHTWSPEIKQSQVWFSCFPLTAKGSVMGILQTTRIMLNSSGWRASLFSCLLIHEVQSSSS